MKLSAIIVIHRLVEKTFTELDRNRGDFQNFLEKFQLRESQENLCQISEKPRKILGSFENRAPEINRFSVILKIKS